MCVEMLEGDGSRLNFSVVVVCRLSVSGGMDFVREEINKDALRNVSKSHKSSKGRSVGPLII